MKATFLAIGLLAIFAAAFAEEVKEDKKELSETGIAVLEKIHGLKKEQEDALAAIDDEEEKDLISSTLDKDEDEADDKLEVPEEGSTRVKRAARRRPHRGAAARRRHQKRAVARRRHQKRAVARKRHQKRAAAIKRRRHQKRAAAARRRFHRQRRANQRRASQKRRAHPRRQNQSRAARKSSSLHKRG